MRVEAPYRRLEIVSSAAVASTPCRSCDHHRRVLMGVDRCEAVAEIPACEAFGAMTDANLNREGWTPRQPRDGLLRRLWSWLW